MNGLGLGVADAAVRSSRRASIERQRVGGGSGQMRRLVQAQRVDCSPASARAGPESAAIKRADAASTLRVRKIAKEAQIGSLRVVVDGKRNQSRIASERESPRPAESWDGRGQCSGTCEEGLRCRAGASERLGHQIGAAAGAASRDVTPELHCQRRLESNEDALTELSKPCRRRSLMLYRPLVERRDRSGRRKLRRPRT